MDLQLQGKKAIVTGGSRGIGKACARVLAREGCDVAICARTESTLRAAAEELAQESGRKVVPVIADSLDANSIVASVRQAAEALGGLDILVNSAARVGGSFPDHVEGIDTSEILRDFEEKAVGYLRYAREVAPLMKQAGWGRIINITGLAGRNPGTGISGAMRNASVVVLTKALANSLGPSGICVNAIYPGATLTEAGLERTQERAQREGVSVESLLLEMAGRNPIKHLVTAEEIGYVAAFLCSPKAIGISGEAIAVTGGAGADVHY